MFASGDREETLELTSIVSPLSLNVSVDEEKVKRILMIAISMAVFAVDLSGRLIALIAGKERSFPLVVLAYHSVAPRKRKAFARQMEQVLRWGKPCRADVGPLSSTQCRPVAVSFDDGYQTLLDNVIPEIEARAIPITIFVAPETLGSPPNWTDYSGGTDCVMSEPIVTAEQLRRLPDDTVQIGSHTVTHPMLTNLEEQDARRELSRTMLEAIIGRKVTTFSFPYGAYSSELISFCRDAGYERVFVTHPDKMTSLSDQYVISRVKVDPEDWPVEFFLKLQGAFRWRNRWRRDSAHQDSQAIRRTNNKNEPILQQTVTRETR
jgi:peptidoglycan/xylan/chitin deacetylase (PgdA/CDA1 family)